MEGTTVVYGLRPPTEARYSTQYDGTPFTDVRDAKIVERFTEQSDPANAFEYTLVGLLFKVKTKGFKFYLLADLDEDPTGRFWYIDMSMLNTNIDEIMIIQDFIRHELQALPGGAGIRIEFKEPETEETEDTE